jgi:hypothetical protein
MEITDVPAILPRVVLDDGGVRIVLPGDPEYGDGYVGEEPLGTWPTAGERARLAFDLRSDETTLGGTGGTGA